ncbi:MAG: accessory Sec system glycosylation chaperone GtfB, partial [Lachnospiraceae bacterium]|nr:accessory Sec system glycosylation chaperone GtfB [Lachnospiraceae bacterium]
DINHEGEIVSAVKQAFLHNQLILGFKQTLHNKTFVPAEHVFDSHERLADFLNRIMDQKGQIREQIDLQKREAMSEEAAAYAALLK